MKVEEVINFLHELDLLEAHLDEHQHFIDETIIVESAVTYSGMPKPLIFNENKERFRRFKFQHEILPTTMFLPIPGEYPEEERKKWYDARRVNREIQQTYIFNKYKGLGDYLANSDVDEIWRRETWGSMLECMNDGFCYIAPNVRRLWCFIDSPGKSQDFWRVTKSTMDTHVRQKGTKRGRTPVNVGWHFSSCYKDMKDMWYKGIGLAQSTGYLGWKTVPGPEQLAELMSKDIYPFLNQKMNPGTVLSKDDLSWLPSFMRDHKEMYPWLPDRLREGRRVITELCG